MMGTNYYFHSNEEEDYCEHCGRVSSSLHIGKSSAGWCFSLRIYPELGINTLEDWEKRWLRGGTIRDEYGRDVSPTQMLSTIKIRGITRMDKDRPAWLAFLAQSDAIEGPNGLARHPLDKRVVGHGEGPWDYVVGEFC